MTAVVNTGNGPEQQWQQPQQSESVPQTAAPPSEQPQDTAAPATQSEEQPAPQGQQEPPPSPEDQINGEITAAQTLEWLTDLFGKGGAEHEAGGGGKGGQFMFASVEELDSVIAQWEAERDSIAEDIAVISNATAAASARAANDEVTTKHSEVAQKSLTSLGHHNVQMLNYANSYIDKLKQSRQQLSAMEADNAARMNATH